MAAEPRTSRRAQGAAIEALAAAHLREHGLTPIAANANARGGELDLVMRDGDSVVFVEVRYRRNARFGGGAASVDAGKRRKLVFAAVFDVIDASGDPEAPTFVWLRDAFRADDV